MSKIATLFAAVMLTCFIALPQLKAQTDTVFFEIVPNDVTLNQGEEQTFDIVVTGFENVVAFQFVINWDTAVLDFVEVGNFNSGVPGFGPGSVGAPGSGQAPNGIITVSYLNFNLTPVSLDDGEILMSMTFEGIGPECSSTTFEIPTGDLEVGLFIDNMFLAAPAVFNTATAHIVCPGGGCGINGLGAATFVCQDSTLGNNNDGVLVEIAYEGMDPQAMVVSNGGGTIAGDDPASVMNGTIIIEGLQEGDPWNIVVTGGNCNLSSSGTIPAGLCNPPPCGVSALETGNEVTFVCNDSTAGPDGVTIEIGYSGMDPDAVVSNNGGGMISGDDPASVMNGTILITGLSEGADWDIEITGGVCMLQSSGTVPANICPQPCLISGLSTELICQDTTISADPVLVEISYLGQDPDVMVVNNGNGTIGGDDPAMTANGTITLAGLQEGGNYNISITGGGCDLPVTGSIPTDLCVPDPCGVVDLETGSEVNFVCQDSTSGDDGVVVEISYFGSDPNAVLANNGGGAIGGDDPAMVNNGTITITGLVEGDDWDISLTGGTCNLQSSGTIPAALCPEPGCGVTAIESGMDVSFVCNDSTGNSDTVLVQIDYTGSDPDAMVVNNAGGIIGGDDPASVADGTLTVTVTEGEDWDISITGGLCNLQSTGTVPADLCPAPVCGISELQSGNEVTITCDTNTAGPDGVTIEIAYTGIDPDVNIANDGAGMISGDDPAEVEDGVIVITDISEGEDWDISLTGGACDLQSIGSVPGDLCAPAACGITDLATGSEVDVFCFGATGGSDEVELLISYTGLDPEATVINNAGGTVEGDDPAEDPDGVIIITGLSEGDSWDIEISGGNCSLSSTGTVAGDECIAELTIDIGEVSGAPGDTVCVDVYAENFIELLGLEYAVVFDTNKLAFTGVQNFEVQGLNAASFNHPPNSNRIFLSWSLFSATGATVVDSTVIYQMCFEIIDTVNMATPLAVDTAGVIEAAMAGTPPTSVPITAIGGEVEIVTPTNELTISLDCEDGAVGDTVCVEVIVQNFEDIIGLEYTVQWNANRLDFVEVADFAFPSLTAGNFSQNGNQLVLSWSPLASNGETLPDGSVLYRMCFEIVGGAGFSAPLSFTGTGEATQAGMPPLQVPINVQGCSIDISGGQTGGDLTISISEEMGACGNTVCVEVAVENFDNILGLEYSIQWDAAVLQYANVEGFNLPSLSGSNFNQIGNTLVFSWNNNTGVTRPDGTVIYRMCFDLVGDENDLSAIEFTGTVEATEAGTPPVQVNPIVTNDGQITIDECGGGGPGDLTIGIDDASGACGNTVCVNVEVENFNNIIGLEYTISWNASILDFSNVEGFNLPSLSGSNFNQIGNTLVFSWNNNTGVTRPDSTAIYRLCFNLVGDENDVSALNFTGNVEATQAGTPPTQVNPVLTEGGQITINSCGGGGPGDLTIVIDEDMGANGDTLCLDVTVENFNDILGLEYTIEWDPSVVQFVNTEGFNLPDLAPGNFNELGNDQLILSWNTNSPVSRPDGTVIYRLCFRLVGGQDDMTGIDFTGSPEATGGTPPNVGLVPINTEDGKITITEGVATNDLIIDIGNAVGENGDTVCVDVDVTNFEDITGLEYTIQWDEDVVDFVNVEGFNLPSLSGSNFNQIGNTLVFSWNNNTGVDRPDGAVIYRMCFEIVGATGDESPVSFTGPAEATQGTLPPVVVPVEEQNGLIEVTGTFAGLTLYAECPNANPGDEVCIPIRVDGFDAIFGGQFSMHWDPAVLEFTLADNFNTDVDGLVVDNVNVTMPGTALFQWTDPFFDGVTLPDGSILFEMCFEVVGDLCDTTTFFFDGNPADIEFGTIVGVQTLPVPVLPQSCLFEVNGCNGPQLQVSIESTRCPGEANGSIALTVDGIMPFTYQWSGLPMGNDAGEKDQEDLPAGEYCVTVTDGNGLTADACYQVGEPLDIEITATVEGETCEGDCDGGIILNVSGGTAPFEYDWADLPGNTNAKNRSNLCDGEYCVTVTDANDCTQTACFNVEAGQVLNLSADITDADCTGADNGAIGLQVTGSINLSYSWDPPAGNTGSLFGLAPGTYCVTVTDDVTGCQVDSCFEVEEIPSFTVTTSLDNVSCHGGDDGRITLIVDGMSNDYSFDWADPITATTSTVNELEAGTYTVTITDNMTGCSSVQSITLTEPEPIVIGLDSVNHLLCHNDFTGAIFATVSGGTPPYTVRWFDEDGNLAGGTIDIGNLLGGCYDLEITDANDCVATLDEVCVDEPAPLDIDASLDNPSEGMCDGAITLEITGGTGPYTYSWDSGLPGNPSHTDLCPGVYCVTITDANNCQLAGCYSLFCPLKVDTFEVTDPICFGDTSGAIDITPTCGVPPYNFLWSNSQTTEDLEDLAGGAYTVTVTDDLGNTAVAGPFTVASPQPISISNVSIQPASCDPNGAINITVSGGTPTYSYLWSSGQTSEDISMLESDSFMVTITDANGCMFISPNYFVPFDPDPPLIEEVEVTPVSCFGAGDGSAMVTAGGCVTPFEYFWVSNMTGDTVSLNVNPNNLAAGGYTLIVVDDFGQATSQQVNVSQPNPISIILDSIVHESCPDGDNGQIFINVGGGNPGGYTYAWNSISSTNQDPGGLSAGSYQVTVTDTKGCTAQSNAFQVNPLPPCICAVEVGSVSCPGETDGSISLSMCEMGLSFQFNWSQGDTLVIPGNGPTLSGLPAGQYFVTITNPTTGATETAVYAVLEPDDWSTQATVNPADECFTGSIDLSVSGANGNYSYAWNDGATTQDRMDLPAGEWSVTISDGQGCTFTNAYLVEGPPCTEGIVSDENCDGDSDGAVDLTAYGIQPLQIQWQLPDGSTINTEDLGSLAPGEYIVQVTDANGMSTTDTFTIETLSFLEATVQINRLPSCFQDDNGSASAIGLNGNGNLSFEWCNGATVPTASGLSAGPCSVTVSDGVGCEVTVDFELDNEPLEFTSQQETCFEDCDGRIQVLPEGGTGPYQFNWNDPLNQNTPIAQELCAGQYTVTVTDALGRTCVVDTELESKDSISLQFSVTPAQMRDGAVTVTVVNGQPPYSYLWGHTDLNDPTAIRLAAGTYTVTVIDDNGCVARGSVEVPGDFDCGTARKIITPNRDGFNDFFIIQCADVLENQLVIFNRWGEVVFEATNYNNDWDGVNQDGELLPEDGYFYIFDYMEQGEARQIKGSITIIRE